MISASAGGRSGAGFVALAIIVGLGVLAWESGAARIEARSRGAAALGVMTPGIVGRLTDATKALERRRFGAAIAAAADAVATAPLDPGAVRGLGTTLFSAGQNARADQVMRAAGALGWRDVGTQVFWSDVAFATGDIRVAAQRLDAAMRVSRGSSPAAAARMRRIEAAPGGVAEVTERLLSAHDWRQPYLNDVGMVADADLDRRVALIRALADRGVPMDRHGSVLVETALLGRLRPDLAYGVWLAAAPPAERALAGRGQLVSDPDLLGVADRDEPGPFDWTSIGTIGLDVTVATAPAPLARRTVRVRATGEVEVPFAERTLALAPGTYLLTAQVVGTHTPAPVMIELECRPQAMQVLAPAVASRLGSVRFEFVVPNPCNHQLLRLHVSGPEARSQADFWLGGVALSRRG